MMNLAHKIQLNPTPEQESYFRQAAGCARFVWNWAEALRFEGKIMSATISRQADRRFVSIQVEVSSQHETRKRKAHHIDGADLGIKTAVVLSSGEGIASPKPLKKALRRLKIRQRRVSHKLEVAKKEAGITGKIPKSTHLPISEQSLQSKYESGNVTHENCQHTKRFHTQDDHKTGERKPSHRD